MFKPKQILVPTDFSPSARAALEDAAAIATTYAAALDVIHVWEISTYTAAGMGGFGLPSTVIDSVSAQAHSMMEELVSEARTKGIAIRNAQVIAGDAARSIVDTATNGKYDLIVIGTHGRQLLARVLLGSVAERVVRHALCPVLVARAKVDNA